MGVPDKGWIVVCPVLSSDKKRAILVRRGWVPDSWREDAAWRQVSPCEGTGVVTRGEIGNAFVPANEPQEGQWFTLDAAAMVRRPGLVGASRMDSKTQCRA
jgi:cytochrome oxidase assembly protein ShyY1